MVLQGLFSSNVLLGSNVEIFLVRDLLIFEHVDGQIGLKGETLNLHTISGSASVEWVQGSLIAKNQPLTWYKVRLNFQQMLYFCDSDQSEPE